MNTYTNNELPVIQKAYGLYKTFYGFAKLFPKKDKYALGNKCETYIIDTLELLIAAGSAPKNEKYIFVRKASVKFDTLKIFIRLADDVGMLDDKKYITLLKQLQEIGSMIGGWLKSLN